MTDAPDTLPLGPWTASRYADGVVSLGWQVKSASGTQILAYVSEPVARAIAAIPEREREIERLRAYLGARYGQDVAAAVVDKGRLQDENVRMNAKNNRLICDNGRLKDRVAELDADKAKLMTLLGGDMGVKAALADTARIRELEEALRKVLEAVIAYLPDQPPKTGRAKTSIDEPTGEA